MKQWTGPILALLVFLLLWHLVVKIGEFPPILLPGPWQVVRAFARDYSRLTEAALVTLTTASMGFATALLVGTGVAMLFAQSRVIRVACFPYAIFVQTVPIVAIAPIVVTWLGEGTAAVAMIAFVVSLFPIVTNGTAGLLSASSELVDLFRLNNASRLQTLLQLQFPASLPYLVAGAKISSGLAVLGAIVGEYFAGAGSERPGLGYLIFVAKGQYRMDLLFAAVVTCTLLGVLAFATIRLIADRWLVHWEERKLE
jgi:NitT/TauT family transport system permease protein